MNPIIAVLIILGIVVLGGAVCVLVILYFGKKIGTNQHYIVRNSSFQKEPFVSTISSNQTIQQNNNNKKHKDNSKSLKIFMFIFCFILCVGVPFAVICFYATDPTPVNNNVKPTGSVTPQHEVVSSVKNDYKIKVEFECEKNTGVGSDWEKTITHKKEQFWSGDIVSGEEGDTAYFEVVIIEDDTHPDKGKASFTVELRDGYSSSKKITVRERNGAHSGSWAKWNVTFTVERIDRTSNKTEENKEINDDATIDESTHSIKDYLGFVFIGLAISILHFFAYSVAMFLINCYFFWIINPLLDKLSDKARTIIMWCIIVILIVISIIVGFKTSYRMFLS